MHSTYFFLLDLEDAAPREGQALLDACTEVFLDRYQSVLDENNWFEPLFCVERGGAGVRAEGVQGQVPSFEDSRRRAAASVISDLSMYGRSLSGEGPVFLDVNPLAFGPRGQDEVLVDNLDEQGIKELIYDRAVNYLAACYARLSKQNPESDLSDYQRAAFVKRFELFRGALDAPFSDSYPTPYDYPAMDLRHAKDPARQAILGVDIHT